VIVLVIQAGLIDDETGNATWVTRRVKRELLGAPDLPAIRRKSMVTDNHSAAEEKTTGMAPSWNS
jgi:hypothetical protein